MDHEVIAEIGETLEIVQILEGTTQCTNCDRDLEPGEKAALFTESWAYFCRPCVKALSKAEDWRPN